jgi:hypothetical protein
MACIVAYGQAALLEQIIAYNEQLVDIVVFKPRFLAQNLLNKL